MKELLTSGAPCRSVRWFESTLFRSIISLLIAGVTITVCWSQVIFLRSGESITLSCCRQQRALFNISR